MTDNNNQQPSEAEDAARKGWMGEAQEALDRVAEALRSAWDTTRDARMSALDSAKSAVNELGEVVERGVTAAKERWAASDQAAGEAGDDTVSTEDTTDLPEDQ